MRVLEAGPHGGISQNLLRCMLANSSSYGICMAVQRPFVMPMKTGVRPEGAAFVKGLLDTVSPVVTGRTCCAACYRAASHMAFAKN